MAKRSSVLPAVRMRVGANTTERFLASILLVDFNCVTLGEREREREREGEREGGREGGRERERKRITYSIVTQ